MGRYISTGTTQTGTNACITYQPASCYQVATHQYSYDANECWQNKLMITRPGSYTFTLPAGTSGCIRAIAVGGGGKAYQSDFYCNFAGSGGGYAESVNSVTPGCTFTIVVGRQQQDTTISYTCTGGVAQTLTGGGAVTATPGAASGGNFMNSRGGCGGWGRNYQEVQGTCASTCLCIYPTTCCGYCIVYGAMWACQAYEDYCQLYYPGGGSAGSFVYCCGGCGGSACNKNPTFSSNDSGGPVAGGGGGIGYMCNCATFTAMCNCVCGSRQGHGCVCRPGSAGGGGGTRFMGSPLCLTLYDRLLYNACCGMGIWRDGGGGRGGLDEQEGRPSMYWWVRHECMGQRLQYSCLGTSVPPKRYPWHDIHSMSGSGSSGKAIWFCTSRGNTGWGAGISQTYQPIPEDAGEGAGTGGSVFIDCDSTYTGWARYGDQMDCVTGINWNVVCTLGLCNRAADAFNPDIMRQVVPGFISRAGTLGGSGGIGMCGFASKAGHGGGGGMFRSFIVCVCYGGNFDKCNGGASCPTLAFPPCILDAVANNAGTGMAVIYWKD